MQTTIFDTFLWHFHFFVKSCKQSNRPQRRTLTSGCHDSSPHKLHLSRFKNVIPSPRLDPVAICMFLFVNGFEIWNLMKNTYFTKMNVTRIIPMDWRILSHSNPFVAHAAQNSCLKLFFGWANWSIRCVINPNQFGWCT